MGDFFSGNFLIALFFIICAALLDILANLLLAKSDGFRRRCIGIAALLCIGMAFFSLSRAIKYDIALSVAYALWGSIGILGTSLGGWIFLRQKLRPCAMVGILFLICGVVLLKMSS